MKVVSLESQVSCDSLQALVLRVAPPGCSSRSSTRMFFNTAGELVHHFRKATMSLKSAVASSVVGAPDLHKKMI